MLSLDLDTADRECPVQAVDEQTPERAFERRWALTVLRRVLDRLERKGVLRSRFAVSRTSSAEQALEWLGNGDYEVLVTDQKMPKVSGLELLERIGDDCPGLVKILISGFTELPEIERALEGRMLHNYVLKPVDGARLLEAIDEAYQVRDGERDAPTQDH